ncbi:MAG: NAD(P)H-binding protein [Opitutae bacterium]|nr:NAD(P)H-binding protein [Opitutae bacterium]
MATALLAGASGLVGGFLLRQLLDAPEYERVVSVGRRRLGLEHPKLVQVVADFGALEKLPEALRGDDAFCCLGTTIKVAGSPEAFRAVDHGAVLAFAWAGKRGGVRRFFTVSSLGADSGSRIFYNRVKGETEEALRVLGFATLAVFRPRRLLGPRKESRPGERIGAFFAPLIEPVLLGRLRRYRAIRAEVVARAMLRCSFGTGARGALIFESDEIQDLGR